MSATSNHGNAAKPPQINTCYMFFYCQWRAIEASLNGLGKVHNMTHNYNGWTIAMCMPNTHKVAHAWMELFRLLHQHLIPITNEVQGTSVNARVNFLFACYYNCLRWCTIGSTAFKIQNALLFHVDVIKQCKCYKYIQIN